MQCRPLRPVRPGRDCHLRCHRTLPHVLPGRCLLCSPPPGWRRALPTSRWPWCICWAAWGRTGSPARFATAARGGSGAGPGPALPWVDRHQRRMRGRGPLSRTCHWLVCLAGVPCAPDRQQRAAVPRLHRVGRSLDTTTQRALSRFGPAGSSSWAATGPAPVSGT